MKRLKLVLVLGGVLALLAGVGVAWATTGATTGYPQPKVVVPTHGLSALRKPLRADRGRQRRRASAAAR